MSKPCDEARPGEQVHSIYTELALHPEKDFGWGKGRENAKRLGYDPAWLEHLPGAVWESSAAVGNPFDLGPIRPDETVVDLGCGAGADVCLAALLVGTGGKVVGIDLTPAMVQRARDNAALTGLQNVEVHEADIVELPLPNACADVVISNGSINLSPSKPCVLKEAYRVLKPGGRFQVADMVRGEARSASPEDAAGSWGNCVAGTVPVEQFAEMIRSAGFESVEFVSFTGYKTCSTTVGATFRARRPA